MRLIKITSLFITLIAATACNEAKQVIDTAGNIQLSGSYTVTSIFTKEVDQELPTITFNAVDKTVNGQTGCNSFLAKYFNQTLF